MGSNDRVTISYDGQGLRLDTAEDAQSICHEITCEEVDVLILQGNTIGVEAAERIRMELVHHPELREAHFKDIFTSRGREEVPVAMDHLLKGISESGAKLTLLDLSDNAIGPIGAPAVIDFLNSSSAETLEKLYLNNYGLGPEGSTSIAVCLPKLKRLREFICGRNRLENKGAINMSRALSELNTLEVLRLPQNGIQVKGITKLCDALNSNIHTIKLIDLSDNTIKAEGADALEGPISRAKNLQVLRLDDALLGNQGFSIICDALSKSQALSKIKEATFEGNEIHGRHIIDLIHLTFSDCQKDFTLNLLANEFERDELVQLQVLSENIEIIVDDLSDLDSDDDSEDGSELSGSDSGECPVQTDEDDSDDSSSKNSDTEDDEDTDSSSGSSTTKDDDESDNNNSRNQGDSNDKNSNSIKPFNSLFHKLEI